MACNCNCSDYDSVIIKGQDFELDLAFTGFDCGRLELGDIAFDVELWSGRDKENNVRVSKEFNEEPVSIGKVYADCVQHDDYVTLYIKASETPLNVGVISSKVTLRVSNENFKDGVQVLKSKETVSDVTIIA